MDILNVAIKAAIKAGSEIMEIYNDPNSDFGIERKKDNSPLTLADKAAHKVIASILSETDIYILSEEGRVDSYAKRSNISSLWIVDPLDGTKEFIKRNGEFTVNIALVTDGVPKIGVVYLPVKGIVYFAAESIGSFRLENVTDGTALMDMEQLIASSDKLPLNSKRDKFTIVASRSHLSDETKAFIERQREKHTDIDCISSGSSIKIALVAEGSADLYPRFAPTMEWDTAAADAVAIYAGAEIVRAEDERPLAYNKENLLNPWFIVRKKS
ncbi:MAG: 3'(2'),5'-bisphosphate nucleotidase CysQ [Bacteroidales bacterium]